MSTLGRVYLRMARFLMESRVASGMTREDLARKLGTSVDFIRQLETARDVPSLATICTFLVAVGVDPLEVFPKPEDERPKPRGRPKGK